MKNAKIINIQKYCVHDGPGIRTTVFFKGCPLTCIWCHNPESQRYKSEIMYNEEKCSKCGECEKRCPHDCIKINEDKIINDYSICSHCENCIDFCVNNARELVGKEYSVNELMKEIEKDKVFYEESGGGVTLSGGEVMSQIDFVEQIVKNCKRKGIHVAIDTCGYAPFESYERIIDYVDLFLYDIKLMNSQRHEKYAGKPNELILKNLVMLSERGANINLRIPLIQGINCDDENIENMLKFIKNLNISSINLLPYHEIGKDKYKRLNINYEDELMSKPSDERIEEIKNIFEKHNFKIKIGG
ncbi:trans-4-hydroxy-L-proline dehydratase activase [Tepidibacter aestuarii]|uniref:trans-4-hydroxy-L-proline dehydratase activase n=1 Tax=Tepidibacter aestuarii TaxID=2925782 RepID=UPI0020BFFB73|nr:trans-4-hydroxy-L-proline dehydratase activase [Tepidibacter aestuarii]CAH2213742.1 Trans-4-hydroxy-L-proline dehydratase activating enzyme [Tepidibacter aestuarii]